MLHNFEMLGNIIGFERVDYFHFWISRWFVDNPYSIDASVYDNNYRLMPIAYPLKIWSNFLKPQMVDSTKQIGKIRTWASYDPGDRSLSLFLLNKDTHRQQLKIKLANYAGASQGEMWLLTGNSPYSTTPVWQQVSTPLKIQDRSISLQLSPLSVTVITLEP